MHVEFYFIASGQLMMKVRGSLVMCQGWGPATRACPSTCVCKCFSPNKGSKESAHQCSGDSPFIRFLIGGYVLWSHCCRG